MLQVVSSIMLSAQHSALAMVEEGHTGFENLQHTKKQVRVTQVATNKAPNDAETAMVKGPQFEAEYVAEVSRRWDEAGSMTRQLHQLVAFATAWSKELAAVHTKLELLKTKVLSLDGALNVIWKEVVARKRHSRGAQSLVGRYWC